jgi:hypothetical protein
MSVAQSYESNIPIAAVSPDAAPTSKAHSVGYILWKDIDNTLVGWDIKGFIQVLDKALVALDSQDKAFMNYMSSVMAYLQLHPNKRLVHGLMHLYDYAIQSYSQDQKTLTKQLLLKSKACWLPLLLVSNL